MAKKKEKKGSGKNRNAESLRNKPLQIPLDFEKAVIGLMNVKPKKNQKPTGS
jgi:hypothetical protein